VSALLGGAVVTLSYGHLLWANALLSWIPVLLVLGVTEPPASPDRAKKRSKELKEILSTTLVGDAVTRLVFLNLVVSGAGGLVMFWVNQKYWQESGVPLAYFGVLLAGYSLIFGFAGKYAALGSARLGRRPLLAAAGALPIIACFGMASFLGWGGILLGTLGQVGRGLGGVLFLNALNEKISSAFRATVISMANLGTRASFCFPGPPRGLWDRRLGTTVGLVGAGNPVLHRLRTTAPSAGSSRNGSAPGSRTTASVMVESHST
jgi:MFS family permease